jgi:hypothetical protein
MSAKLSVVCTEWRALRKNTLIGFATVEIREMRLVVHDVSVHRKGDRLWAALPSRPWVKNGARVTDADGKTRYSVLFEFIDKPTGDAFSKAVLRAISERFPDALAVEAVA